MEATVICLDNSEWMRNGDFAPSRLISQSDAAILMCTSKINQNPESAVAVISMAGKGPKVLITLSNDDGKLLNAISSVQIEGKSDILSTLQLAQLTLKHKQNKSQKQRIILFVGSPVSSTKNDLVRIGKRLKKNNTAVDIVSFGETVENAEKLQSFHDAVDNNDNSALLSVPSGPHNLSDFLRSFPSILNANSSSSSSSGGDNFMGVDPQTDPELAAALRMSLEDYEKESPATDSNNNDNNKTENKTTESNDSNPMAMDLDMDDELQKAIKLSMMEFNDNSTNENDTEKKEEEEEAPVPDAMEFDDDDDANLYDADDADDNDLYDDLDEEAQLALAMEMSMNSTIKEDKPKEEEEETEEKGPDSAALVDDALNDPSFMDSIFDNIEGVDASDPLIQSTIKDLNKNDSDSKKDDENKSN